MRRKTRVDTGSRVAAAAALLTATLLSSGVAAAAAGGAPERLYISDETGGDVVIVDPQGRSVVARIAVGKRPRGIQLSSDHELNVSSDIDLVLLYPGAMGEHERYETAGKKLIRLLAEHTEDGFAFRVDMRLRPFGDSGPLVCSFDSLETYLIAHGREWERYAWLKARPLTGSHHEELMKIVRPFVFRKYLDYATLGAMRRLHAEVRREVARRELADHVKLGPGGIREIEFVAQALQLVRGGRDPALTTRPTREALKRLAEHPRLDALRSSQRYAALPAESRRRLDLLLPALARASAATADPQATLARGVDLVEAIASRAAYLALLAENPHALERVTRIIGASSWAAEFVTRHPLLLDELLDDRLLYAPPDL